MQSLQTDIHCRKWIDRAEVVLQRPLTVEDYRQDEHLREFVMQAIVKQNPNVFSDIFETLAVEMQVLKERLK
jgi:hypothetical protein